MKRKRSKPHRRQKRISAGNRQGERTDQPGVQSDFASVDAITRAAEQSGWPAKDAFAAAMYLTLHGTSADEAERAFADAARRLQ
jgi:hypothetical protein